MTNTSLSLVRLVPSTIVHISLGRIRIRIPRLGFDTDYAESLQALVAKLDFVLEVRINIWARSLIVHYDINKLASDSVGDRLGDTIQQAAIPQISQLAIAVSGSSDQKLSGNLRGKGWMLLATAYFAGMQALIRFVSGSIHPFQIAFFSNLFGIAILLPWLNRETLRTEQLHLHGLRSLIDTGATLLLFTGISLTPLAQANALGFTTPLFAILGAVIFLNEPMAFHNWVALLLGVVGTIVILRPGVEIVGLGAILILVGSIALAGVLLLLKQLSKTDSSMTSNAYTVLFLTALTLIPALLVWQMPTLLELIGMAAIAAFMVGGQMAVGEAFVNGDATAVLPVDFAQLIWSSTLGFLLFAEVPDLWVIIGGLLIFAGSLYSAYSENLESEELAIGH